MTYGVTQTRRDVLAANGLDPWMSEGFEIPEEMEDQVNWFEEPCHLANDYYSQQLRLKYAYQGLCNPSNGCYCGLCPLPQNFTCHHSKCVCGYEDIVREVLAADEVVIEQQ